MTRVARRQLFLDATSGRKARQKRRFCCSLDAVRGVSFIELLRIVGGWQGSMGFRKTLRQVPTKSENSKLEEWRLVCVGMLGVARRGREARREWQHRMVCERMQRAEQKRRKLCRSSCLVRSQSGCALEKRRERVAAGSTANGRLYEKISHALTERVPSVFLCFTCVPVSCLRISFVSSSVLFLIHSFLVFLLQLVAAPRGCHGQIRAQRNVYCQTEPMVVQYEDKF